MLGPNICFWKVESDDISFGFIYHHFPFSVSVDSISKTLKELNEYGCLKISGPKFCHPQNWEQGSENPFTLRLKVKGLSEPCHPDVMMSLRESNNVIVYVLSLKTIYILLPYLNITDLYKTHIYRSSSYEYTDIK